MVLILEQAISMKVQERLIHYMAETKRQQVVQTIRNTKFFSLLLDGSTDKGNIDNELILVVWCDANGNDRIRTKISHLNIVRPKTVSAQGLFDVVEVFIKAWCTVN